MEDETLTSPMISGLTAVISWGLTYVLGRVLTARHFEAARAVLPSISVLFAVGVVSFVNVWRSGEFSFATVWAGIMAAGLTILGHSQARELFKVLERRRVRREEDGKAATAWALDESKVFEIRDEFKTSEGFRNFNEGGDE